MVVEGLGRALAPSMQDGRQRRCRTGDAETGKDRFEMATTNETRTDGMMDEAKGKVKEGVGNLTGNEKTQGEGMLDQAMGKVKQGVADVKDKVSEAVDKAKSS